MKHFFIIAFILFSVTISWAQSLKEWKAGTAVTEEAVRQYGIDNCFQQSTITDAIFSRMWLKSFKKNCQMNRNDLRYLRILHRNAEGKPQMGELVCNKRIAGELLEIFRKLYDANYKIGRMVLVDNYDADDEKSMTANNTSCFNYRPIAGSSKMSKHSQGLAIDINPIYNPCLNLRTGLIQPANGKAYARNREKITNAPTTLISPTDLCYRLFKEYGYRWGGDWRTVKDYQHFEK